MKKYKNSEKRRAQWREYYRKHHVKRLDYHRKYYQRNKKKIIARQKKYYQKHKKNMKFICWKNSLKRKYGLTVKQYNSLLKKQNNRCAICNQKSNNERLHVDHNHKTGKVRGLLCQTCNRILGMIKDNTDWLKKSIKYLKTGEI